MAVRETILRYNLIIQKLRKHPASLEEIQNYLAQESEKDRYNLQTSLRTFQRDKTDILTIYKIDIQYNPSQKKYYIASDNEQPEVSENLLAAFDVFNALSFTEKLPNAIYFENRRPQGTEHFYGLVHAIKNRQLVHFTYEKFWEEEIVQRTVEPYALKQFRNRWYLIAKDVKDEYVKTFALDRLSGLDITKKKYKLPDDYNMEERYSYSFGIMSPNEGKPKTVLLSFSAHQGKYIKTLPLHSTQEITMDNEEELRIRLKLFITHDFIMELLSYGDEVQVLQPKSLAGKIKAAHQRAYEQYANGG